MSAPAPSPSSGAGLRPRPGELVVHAAPCGSTHVIKLAGELDLATAGCAKAELERAIGSGVQTIVLDLRELEFMDSSGVQLIAEGHGRLLEAGRRLVIAGARRQARRILDVCGLATVLEVSGQPRWQPAGVERRPALRGPVSEATLAAAVRALRSIDRGRGADHRHRCTR